jgi:hypothetical protein
MVGVLLVGGQRDGGKDADDGDDDHQFDEREATLEGAYKVFHDDAPLERKRRKNKKSRERAKDTRPRPG